MPNPNLPDPDEITPWTGDDRTTAFNAGEQAAQVLIDKLAPWFYRSQAEQGLQAHPELVSLVSNFVIDSVLAKRNGQPQPALPPIPAEVAWEAAKKLGAK